jgi:acetate kinase
MNILVLNAGSSSLKFCHYRMERLRPLDEPEETLVSGTLERIGTPDARLQVTYAGRQPAEQPIDASTIGHAAEQVISLLTRTNAPDGNQPQTPEHPNTQTPNTQDPTPIDAVGHRIVHGGDRFYRPTLVDAEVRQAIRDLTELAPLHNPAGLAGIETGLNLLPHAPAVAVFDTAFHHDLPPQAALYALPPDLKANFPVRRYGFHGISYSYVSARLLHEMGREAVGTRLILCHLGNGASVCALRDGKSVDTSMGFTPLEGLVMGSRSGDVDPGLLLYLIHTGGYDATQLEELLNHRSGMLGLSGRSGDVRDLEQAASSGDARAEQALSSFAYRVRKYIGAYAAVLGGLDALAFTGGIGEHGAQMRARICEGLDYWGLKIDPNRNTAQHTSTPQQISTPDSKTPIWVVPTDEERLIARETYTLLQQSLSHPSTLPEDSGIGVALGNFK